MMRRMTMVILGMLLVSLTWAGVSAANLYISDIFEINMRTGAGNEYRITALLPSGTRLELLEEGEEWSRVRTENGREGWVLKRFISPEPPARMVVERLQRENGRLKTAADTATAQVRDLTTENKEISSSLAGVKKELAGLQQQYDSLRTDAASVMELKERYERSTGQLELAVVEKERLAGENQELRSEARMRWFLTGAGVMGGSLLFGFVMGRVQRRSKRASLYS
jgi:SH3 domain protein